MLSEQSTSPLTISIACALLQPSLHSLLIFDASFEGLQQIAQQMVALATAAGQKLRPVVMSATDDDDLWGTLMLPDRDGKLETRTQLFAPPSTDDIPLIIIPDLAALSLASARACIQLVDANVVHLERHGQHAVWSPRYYWLAGCRQDAVGAVSSHLLDRFALRLSWRSSEQLALSHQERVRSLQEKLERGPSDMLPALDPGIVQQLQQAVLRPPRIEIYGELYECLLTYFSGDIIHPRRELALGHYALALARLVGATHLQKAHIEQAAEMMGLRLEAATDPGDEATKPEQAEARTAPAEGDKASVLPAPEATEAVPRPVEKNIELQLPEPQEQSPVDLVISAPDPYPEDTQPILHEVGSLQLPPRHVVAGRSDRGAIIGVEPTTTLRDLALVSTIMRALLFQAVRPRQDPAQIVLDWTDLRRYRRAAEPEHLLLLLLDYTCMSLAQRQQALIPYLSQAYRERASITIIKVGAATEKEDSNLRADYVSARNILVPAISAAIDAAPGSATPLAHGLELATQILQRALQHGRSTVQQVTFVVVSDGRGNVPLAASHNDRMTRPVTREGVDDALQQVRAISEMRRVSCIVLAPRVRYYQDLPQRLADALGAQLLLVEDEEDELA